MFATFNHKNFQDICDLLAAADPDLAMVIEQHGYPPMWSRPNTFESLVHIILEQQVSLASALAALTKLKERIGEFTPAQVLLLTDDDFKSCYFSRQKTIYTRCLAEAIVAGRINLNAFETLPDDEVRLQLTSLKGIGNWTVDVYLMCVLHRADVFPPGDLAAVLALKKLKGLPASTPKETLIQHAAVWQPYRTVATMILWHFYLSSRKK